MKIGKNPVRALGRKNTCFLVMSCLNNARAHLKKHSGLSLVKVIVRVQYTVESNEKLSRPTNCDYNNTIITLRNDIILNGNVG